MLYTQKRAVEDRSVEPGCVTRAGRSRRKQKRRMRQTEAPLQPKGQQPQGRRHWRKVGPRAPRKMTRERQEPNHNPNRRRRRTGARGGRERRREPKTTQEERRKERKERERTRPKEQKGRAREDRREGEGEGRGRRRGGRKRRNPKTERGTREDRDRGRERKREKRRRPARQSYQPEPLTWSPVRPEEFVIGSGGPPKDCTHVFPMKGAADALCNPKADVPGGVAGQAARCAREKLGEAWRRCGPQFCPRGTLRGGVGFGRDTAARRDGGTENNLSGNETAPLVDIQGVKIGPDGGAEIAASGEAANVSSGSVLAGGPGTDPTRGDAKGLEAPSVRGVPMRRPRARRMSVSAARRPAGCASGGTVRQEYRTLAHREQDLRRQKAP